MEEKPKQPVLDIEKSIRSILDSIDRAQQSFANEEITTEQYYDTLNRIQLALTDFTNNFQQQELELSNQLKELSTLLASIEENLTTHPTNERLLSLKSQLELLIKQRSLESQKLTAYLPLLIGVKENLHNQCLNALDMMSHGVRNITNTSPDETTTDENQPTDDQIPVQANLPPRVSSPSDPLPKTQQDSPTSASSKSPAQPNLSDSPLFSTYRPPSLKETPTPTILPPVNADLFPSSPKHPHPGAFQKGQRGVLGSPWPRDGVVSQISEMRSRIINLEQDVAVYGERSRSMEELQSQAEREVQTIRRELQEASRRETESIQLVNKLLDLLKDRREVDETED
ncbi:hypothetical protein BLNAU_1140 [Blattamonas nauphoetae]|uniref:Uncharacterized protein n=1 Tax=Blattamonas nauphoetae TaxID=2049346 RepID=A0ABQ9YJY9_9EUKA|nr:hypothetical protein BLNAU_1140 [Blattamonas nauphoetae]